MKSQNIVKGGAAIGGAVALLLISVLFAPSTALAGGGIFTGKLNPTGVEAGASGQVKLTVVSAESSGGLCFITGAMTVTCRGLTPGQAYGISGGEGGAGFVANAKGELRVQFTGGFILSLNGNGFFVAVWGPGGTVLTGRL
jgi:hypothetical protein